MKISNWRRKIATSLVAGGLLSPSILLAANLNTNLALNGDFESVDLGTPGVYNAFKLNNWTDGTRGGFAYSYSLNYDFGTPPVGGGTYFFTANQSGGDATDVTARGVVSQLVDVSAGATGAAIASGKGRVNLSAFFTSYDRPAENSDGDIGNVTVEFLDSSNKAITSVTISDPSPYTGWKQYAKTAAVPIGTAKFNVSLYGTPFQSGPDGYIDNLDVRMTEAATNQYLVLEVNTLTGAAAIKNQSGQSIPIDYYEITSAGNALNSVAWNSLQEQNAPGYPAGNGSGNGWEAAGGANGKVVGESYLRGNSYVANNANLSMGGLFNVGGTQDLVFRYGQVTNPPTTADFDDDGDADGADFLIWQRNTGIVTQFATRAQGDANANLTVDAADLAVWKTDYSGPAGSSKLLLQGLVRYVTSGPVTAVPEPTTVVLAGLGLAGLAVSRARRR